MSQISDKQLQANQINALTGGVKTDAGKEIVRFNARKHGILAILISNYEQDFYHQILDQLIDELNPTTAVETIIVERVAVYYLRLQRLAKAENELIKSCIDKTERNDLFFSFSDITKQGYKPILSPGDIELLHRLYARYETAIENRLYRAIKELQVYSRIKT
jgi:hypothetical protein